MSKIKNGGLDHYTKCKALTGSAVKGLTVAGLRWFTDLVHCTHQNI